MSFREDAGDPARVFLGIVVLSLGVYWPLFAGCGAANQLATSAPTGGEAALLETEVVCLIDRASQGETPQQANDACLVDPTPAKQDAGAHVCAAHIAKAPLTVLVQATGQLQGPLDAASTIVTVLVSPKAVDGAWPSLDAPSEVNTWAPDAVDVADR